MDKIIADFFDYICSGLQYAICSLLKTFMKGFTDGAFTPSIETFKNAFGGDEGLAVILDFFEYFGYVIAIMLFIFTMLMFLRDGGQSVKEPIFMLLYRMVFTLIMIKLITSFGDVILEQGQTMAAKATEYFGSLSAEDNSYGKLGEVTGGVTENFLAELDKDITASTDPSDSLAFVGIALVGSVAAPSVLSLGLLAIIIRAILFGILCYNLAKLIIELVSRYMMMMTLYITGPAVVGLYASPLTANVFSSFSKMFGAQVGIMVLTQVWISLSLYLMSHLACGFVNFFMMLAFIRIGLRAEQLLKEMGFSIGSMGGALLDNAVMTGAILGMAVSKGSRAAGNGLLNAGGLTGNIRLGQAGNLLLRGDPSAANAARAMQHTAGGVLREGMENKGLNNLAKSISKNGMARNNDAIGILNATAADKRKDMAQAALDKTMANTNARLASMGQTLEATGKMTQDGMQARLVTRDSDGNIISSQLGTVSERKGNGNSLTLGGEEDGKKLFFSTDDAFGEGSASGPVSSISDIADARIQAQQMGLDENAPSSWHPGVDGDVSDCHYEGDMSQGFVDNMVSVGGRGDGMGDGTSGNPEAFGEEFSVGKTLSDGSVLHEPEMYVQDKLNQEPDVGYANTFNYGENGAMMYDANEDHFYKTEFPDQATKEEFHMRAEFADAGDQILLNGEIYEVQERGSHYGCGINHAQIDTINLDSESGDISMKLKDGSEYVSRLACHEPEKKGRLFGNNVIGERFLYRRKQR